MVYTFPHYERFLDREAELPAPCSRGAASARSSSRPRRSGRTWRSWSSGPWWARG